MSDRDLIPDLLLERLRLGELDPVAAERLRASMSPADEARLAAMAADDARLLAERPPRVVAAAVAARASRPARRSMALWLAPALVAAGALAVFALRGVEPIGPETPLATADAGVRAKGDDRLLVYRRVGEGEELLADEAAAGPGDVLQLALSLKAGGYVVVQSVDGAGAITAHFPPEGAPAGPLDAGRHALDHAFALDDAPAFERFVMVTADAPIDPDAVRAALAATPDGPLALPDGWRQSSVTLRKAAR